MSDFTWEQAPRPLPYPYPERDPSRLWVVESFLSIQGEGHRAGELSYFIRLARCNLRCLGCDTFFDEYTVRTPEEIASEARDSGARWAILTGGEPALHDLSRLVDHLHRVGLRVAIETNGTLLLPSTLEIDWVTVSPKTTTPRQREGDELKVLMTPELSGEELEAVFGPDRFPRFEHRFVQPTWGCPASLARAVAFVRGHPWWRLSVQVHKYIGEA